jgi:hypothetical protein
VLALLAEDPPAAATTAVAPTAPRMTLRRCIIGLSIKGWAVPFMDKTRPEPRKVAAQVDLSRDLPAHE